MCRRRAGGRRRSRSCRASSCPMHGGRGWRSARMRKPCATCGRGEWSPRNDILATALVQERTREEVDERRGVQVGQREFRRDQLAKNGVSFGGTLTKNAVPKPGRRGSETLAAKIVVVSGDDGHRSRLIDVLSGAGYRTSGAATFAEAKRMLGSSTADLVIAEERLGDYNGLHVIVLGR